MYQPTETQIVRSILDGLAAMGIMAWRVNTGAMTGEHNGKQRFVRFRPKGQADIQGILSPSGRVLSIEVKRPGGRMTAEQLGWQNMIQTRGGWRWSCIRWRSASRH